MKTFFFFLALTWAGLVSPQNQETSSHQSNLANFRTKILGVNIINMKDSLVLENQTIIIENGLIAEIYPTAENVEGTFDHEINAKGMYVIPGLHDMHTHVETLAFAQAMGAADIIDLPYEALLSTYLANGITTIQILSGGEDLLQIRDEINEKNIQGPTLIVGSPMLDGSPPILPEPFTLSISKASEVKSILNSLKEKNYDFIKLRVNLSRPIFEEINRQAKSLNLPLIGHIPRGDNLSLKYVVETKDFGIAHLEEFSYDKTNPTPADIEAYIQLLKKNNGHVITTLNVFDNIIDKLNDYDATLASENVKYVHRLFKNLWLNNPFQEEDTSDYRTFIEDQLLIQKKLTKAFYKAGVEIMVGTDALNPTIIPGYSMHRELELIMESGLNAYEVLRMATVIPAKHLDPSNKLAGTITIGQKADLVILKSNPLANLTALKQPEFVIRDGMVLGKKELSEKLSNLASLLED